jgi:outer membrane protein
MYKLLIVGLSLLGMNCPLMAEEVSPQSLPRIEEGLHGSVGLLAFARSQPYKGMNGNLLLLPALNIEKSDFYLRGITAGYRLLSFKQRNSIDLILRPRLVGYRADDGGEAFRGMHNRSDSLHGGVSANMQFDSLKLNIDALTDLLGKSKGQEVSASVGNAFRLDPALSITPSVGLKWQSEKYTDYYYGVTAQEASLVRPLYKGKSVLNYTAGLNVNYLLNKQSHLFAQFEYERLGSEITDSPLVEDNKVMRFYLGYGWHF